MTAATRAWPDYCAIIKVPMVKLVVMSLPSAQLQSHKPVQLYSSFFLPQPLLVQDWAPAEAPAPESPAAAAAAVHQKLTLHMGISHLTHKWTTVGDQVGTCWLSMCLPAAKSPTGSTALNTLQSTTYFKQQQSAAGAAATPAVSTHRSSHQTSQRLSQRMRQTLNRPSRC